MTLLGALIIAFLITAIHGTGLQCNKPNEEARSVSKCPPEKTCRTRNIQVNCLQIVTEQYETKCVCKDGYYKNPAGDCVTSEDCDKCTRQNQYYSCRTTPDKLCSDLQKSDSSKGDNQSVSVDNARNATTCKPQCYCNPGTARDENDECVPYDQCNQPCGDAEVKDYCPSDCAYDYCPKEDVKSVKCPQPTPCPKPRCKCGFNSRRAENGTCISTMDCPPFDCKKPFEEFHPCPPICPNGRCEQATETGRCPAIFGRIGIVLECNPQCRCKKGYWWNETMDCVPYNQCPGKGK